MGSLDGKIAIVTGAGQGVGQGIALALGAEGASIAVLGRTMAKLEATCALVRERGARAEPFRCDVGDLDAVPAVVDAVAARFGGIDILVNNAYSGSLGPLLSLSDADFQQGFRTGPFAAFALMTACHPHMARRGGGSIVNLVSSAMVRWDPSAYGAYAAAKQALRSLTRTAAAEWGRDGIRANCVAPLAVTKPWLTYADLSKSATLGYNLGTTPDTSWGTAANAAPPSDGYGEQPVPAWAGRPR